MPHFKIIVTTMLICAALVGALFLTYSLPKKKLPLVIPNEMGTLFTPPRDIKPFTLYSAQVKPFRRQDLYHHWTLVFFGFTHCQRICPTTLHFLKKVYVELQPKIPSLQIAFISLDPEQDTIQKTVNYAHQFHPQFIGLTGKISELHKLQSQFGIYAKMDEMMQDKQIVHSTSLLLINPQGKWAGLFKINLSPQQFAYHLQKVITL